jgi:hypothetical protein
MVPTEKAEVPSSGLFGGVFFLIMRGPTPDRQPDFISQSPVLGAFLGGLCQCHQTDLWWSLSSMRCTPCTSSLAVPDDGSQAQARAMRRRWSPVGCHLAPAAMFAPVPIS